MDKPKPPLWASAITNSDSLTVSIAADNKGMLSLILFVKMSMGRSVTW